MKETNTAKIVLNEELILWKSLATFPIGGADAERFAKKLAEQEGWNEGYARRVIDEYRRFIFLAATGRELTVPSAAVDAVWHLHLTYTVSYWEELCGTVIKKPLHHLPSDGKDGSNDYLAICYRETLQRYENIFDEGPPDDIWPRPKAVPAAETRTKQHSWFKKNNEEIILCSLAGACLSGFAGGITAGHAMVSLMFFIATGALFSMFIAAFVSALWTNKQSKLNQAAPESMRRQIHSSSNATDSGGGCTSAAIVTASCSSACDSSNGCGDGGSHSCGGASCGGGSSCSGGGCGGGGCGG